MTPLVLIETIKSARPLPGAQPPIYCRSFHAQRPAAEHRFSFQPTSAALDPAATPTTLLAGIAFNRIPQGRRGDYCLVVNLAGGLHTIDEVTVDGARVDQGETVVQLNLTRVESAEGEPAPLDVFLIMTLDPEILRVGRVRFIFLVQRRPYAGNVTIVRNAIPDCFVDLTSP